MKKDKGMKLIWPAAFAAAGIKPGATKWLASLYSADASAADATIYDPGAGDKFVLCGISMDCNPTATPTYIKDGATTIMNLYARQNGIDLSNCPYVSTAAANKLIARATAGGNISINAWGYEID